MHVNEFMSFIKTFFMSNVLYNTRYIIILYLHAYPNWSKSKNIYIYIGEVSFFDL
jgi:hypothetical protein